MPHLDAFIGTWELDPSQNNYQTPNAPLQGSYIISQIDHQTLQFDMAWTDANGNHQTMQYTSVVDGNKHPYENPEIAEFVQTELLETGVMESRTYKNNQVIAKGLRHLKTKNTMQITQETTLPNGQTITNTSVYHRVTKPK